MAPTLPDEDKDMSYLDMMTKMFESQMKYNEAVKDAFQGISDSLKESAENFGRRKI